MKLLVAIVGPTGSGKTELGYELAKRHNGAVICADSRTIYRGLDIGTAKPTAGMRREVPHYGLDMVEPGQAYSVADFKTYAEQTMAEIWSAGQLPFLVGGSGLYVDAVLFGYRFRDTVSKLDVHRLTEAELARIAHERYPAEYTRTDRRNRRRLEALVMRGPSGNDDRSELKKDALIIGIRPENTLLKQNIGQRIRTMLNKGFVQEVEELRNRYGRDCPQLRTTGYWPIVQYLDKTITLEQAQQRIMTETWKLARKQLTWLRRNPHIHWLPSASVPPADALIIKYLARKPQ